MISLISRSINVEIKSRANARSASIPYLSYISSLPIWGNTIYHSHCTVDWSEYECYLLQYDLRACIHDFGSHSSSHSKSANTKQHTYEFISVSVMATFTFLPVYILTYRMTLRLNVSRKIKLVSYVNLSSWSSVKDCAPFLVKHTVTFQLNSFYDSQFWFRVSWIGCRW